MIGIVNVSASGSGNETCYPWTWIGYGNDAPILNGIENGTHPDRVSENENVILTWRDAHGICCNETHVQLSIEAMFNFAHSKVYLL